MLPKRISFTTGLPFLLEGHFMKTNELSNTVTWILMLNFFPFTRTQCFHLVYVCCLHIPVRNLFIQSSIELPSVTWFLCEIATKLENNSFKEIPWLYALWNISHFIPVTLSILKIPVFVHRIDLHISLSRRKLYSRPRGVFWFWLELKKLSVKELSSMQD